MIKFIVEGESVAKARPRVTKWGTYTPKKTKDYEKLVQWSYKQQCKGMKAAGPIKIKLDFYMYIPKNTSKKRRKLKENKEILPTKKPDWDNLAKSVTDALNGIAYDDDNQIVKAEVNKYFSENMRVEVEITEIEKEEVDMINRENIRAIKRYDNREMKLFLSNYYNAAYEEGLKKGIQISSKTDYMELLIKALDNTKGIGDKRKQDILMNLQEIWRE